MVNKYEVNDLINKLNQLRSAHEFTGLKLNDLPTYIAIDKSGNLALIIPAIKSIEKQHLRTDLVSLRLGVNCTLSIDGEVSVDRHFNILECVSTDKNLQEMFLVLSVALVIEINDISNAAEILISYFTSLIQLFKTMPSSNLTNERQGLWGELFILKLTGDILHYAKFWHNDPNRKFDFSAGNRKLEVKTTTGLERVHSFSHQQLYVTDNKQVVIASLLLRPDDTGLSLRELILEVRSALKNDVQLLTKLERAVLSAGMGNLGEPGPIFDENDAKTNIAWFMALDVPKFSIPEPPGVSNTHYRVDLSTALRMEDIEVLKWFEELA